MFIKMELVHSALRQPRFEIDPNAPSRKHPDWRVSDLSSGPWVHVGDVVAVAQPDAEGGADYIGTARVVDVNHKYDLVYLDVDWSSFHDEVVSSKVLNKAVSVITADLFFGVKTPSYSLPSLNGSLTGLEVVQT